MSAYLHATISHPDDATAPFAPDNLIWTMKMFLATPRSEFSPKNVFCIPSHRDWIILGKRKTRARRRLSMRQFIRHRCRFMCSQILIENCAVRAMKLINFSFKKIQFSSANVGHAKHLLRRHWQQRINYRDQFEINFSAHRYELRQISLACDTQLNSKRVSHSLQPTWSVRGILSVARRFLI